MAPVDQQLQWLDSREALKAHTAVEGLRIVVYTASWCPPCSQLKACLKSFKEDKDKANGWEVAYVDVDKADIIAKGIQSVPTIRFYKNGRRLYTDSGYGGPKYTWELIQARL